MSRFAFVAVFTGGVLLHHLEEACWLPAWSARNTGLPRALARSYRPREFTLAAGLLSAGFVGGALASLHAPARSARAYLFCGLALAMGMNALVPHLLASVYTRSYMPGTATALLLNFPLGTVLILRELRAGQIEAGVFLWAGPLTTLLLLGTLRPLFVLARLLDRAAQV